MNLMYVEIVDSVYRISNVIDVTLCKGKQTKTCFLVCFFFFAFPQFQLSAKGLLNQQSYQQIYTPIAQTNLIDEWMPI